MKIYSSVLITCILIFLLAGRTLADSYYINPETGNDMNTGTSPASPFRSLSKVSSLALLPGDQVLLAAGRTFYGTLILKNVAGTPDKPVIVSSYSETKNYGESRPLIDAKGFPNGILILNCSYIEVRNINITANAGGDPDSQTKGPKMRCGVLVKVTEKGNFDHIYLKDLSIRDIFFEEKGFLRGSKEVKTANGSQNYGWGIRFINDSKEAVLSDARVESCVVKNVSHTGIKFTAPTNGIRNIFLKNDTVLETGGPGVQMSGVKDGLVTHNYISFSGSNDDSRKWGRGSGLWTWGTSDVIIQNNYFLNAKGPGDSAGCHIDYNCRNVVVQYNFSANNAGGFCEILGNNYNCSYRYNISVNDGYRIKGKDGAFQEGKILMLSGYVGEKPQTGPFNTYFYNNTIYVKKDIVAKMSIAGTTNGILIMNNIFYIEGESHLVLGDQINPDLKSLSSGDRVVFRNNLFLRRDNWPQTTEVTDSRPLTGDPGFSAKGGMDIRDYIPANKKLVAGKGVEIPTIPGDSAGLSNRLKVPHDILGNKIKGKPDMGAIELY